MLSIIHNIHWNQFSPSIHQTELILLHSFCNDPVWTIITLTALTSLRANMAIRYVLLTFDINYFMTTITKMKSYPYNNNKKGDSQRPIYLIHSTRSISIDNTLAAFHQPRRQPVLFIRMISFLKYFILVYECARLNNLMSLTPGSHVVDPNKVYIAFYMIWSIYR